MVNSAALSEKMKKKPELKKFENIEASELTQKEQEGISRSLLLRWYKSNKLAKLKAFQVLLEEEKGNYAGDEIESNLLKNTQKEFTEDLKGVSKEVIKKKAEEFTQNIMAMSDAKDIRMVLAEQAVLDEDETMFHKTLDAYVGKDKLKQRVDRLFENKQMQQMLLLIKEKNIGVYEDIKEARQKGDYSRIKELISEGSDGMISKAAVDIAITGIVLGSKAEAKLTSMQGILSYIDSLRSIGHISALKSAAAESKVPYLFVLQFAGKTFHEMKQMDNRLQKNLPLLEQKEHKSKNELQRIEFIKNVHTLVGTLEKGLTPEMENVFKSSLEEHLKKKKMAKRDRAYVLAHAKIDDLKMLQIYELIYSTDTDNNRWFLRTLNRIPTMMRTYKQVFHAGGAFHRSMALYNLKRARRGAAYYTSHMFTDKYKKWGLTKISTELDDIEKLAKMNNKKVDFDFVDKGMKIPTNELFDADILLKRYREAVKRATVHMSNEAKRTLALGKTIDKISGKEFATQSLEDLMKKKGPLHKHSEVIQSMFEKGALKGKVGADLVGAYGSKIVDIKTMNDATRARFSAVAELVETNVTSPLNKRWAAQQDVLHGRKAIAKNADKLDDVKELLTTTGKTKYLAKKLVLPGLIIGTQVHALIQGTAKTRDVLWDGAEGIGGLFPGIGTGLDFWTMWKGRSLSGRRLGWKERALAGFFGTIGLVSDVAWVAGGLGGWLRAGIGAMKGTVKTARMIKTADKLRDAANVAEVGGLFGKIGKYGKIFKKSHRLEKFNDAGLTLKAYKQTDLMRNLKNMKGLETGGESLETLMKTEKGLETLKGLNKGKELDKINKLLKLTKQADKFIDYKKLFETHKLGGKALEMSDSIIKRGWTKTKLGFLKIKKWLHSKGASKELVENYEKSFDAMENARKGKEKAIAALQAAEVAKGKNLQNYQETFKNLSSVDLKYAKMLERERDIKKSLKVAEIQEATYTNRWMKLKKVKKGKQSRGEIKSVERLSTKAKKRMTKLQEELSNNKAKIGGLKIDKTDTVKALDQANLKISSLEMSIVEKTGIVKTYNADIYNISRMRSIDELKMLQVNNAAFRWGNELKTAASYMQKAGLAVGGLWMLSSTFTDTSVDPAKQWDYAKKGAGMAMGAAGAVTSELLADHGRVSLDIMIENRVNNFKRMGELDGKVTKVRKDGGNVYEYYAKNWRKAGIREHASRNNINLNKINMWRNKMPNLERVKGAIKSGLDKGKGAVKEKLKNAKNNL